MDKKSYYAIIPANVRYDKDLSANAKLLYGEITALCNEKGYCWATNSYFAELYGVSNKSISRWISQLIEKKYIHSQIIYKVGTKEIEQRRLYITPPMDNNVYTLGQKCHEGKDKNVQDNNTINNTNNIYIEQCNELWSMYPKKVGKQKAYKKIPKLLKEYSFEELKRCVERYSKEASTKDKQFILQGDTFFNGRFEDYLDENYTTNNVSSSISTDTKSIPNLAEVLEGIAKQRENM